MKPNEKDAEETSGNLSELTERDPVADGDRTSHHADWNREDEKCLHNVDSPMSSKETTTTARNETARCCHTIFPGFGFSLADKLSHLADLNKYFDMVSSSFSNEKLQDFVT